MVTYIQFFANQVCWTRALHISSCSTYTGWTLWCDSKQTNNFYEIGCRCAHFIQICLFYSYWQCISSCCKCSDGYLINDVKMEISEGFLRCIKEFPKCFQVSKGFQSLSKEFLKRVSKGLRVSKYFKRVSNRFPKGFRVTSNPVKKLLWIT